MLIVLFDKYLKNNKNNFIIKISINKYNKDIIDVLQLPDPESIYSHRLKPFCTR